MVRACTCLSSATRQSPIAAPPASRVAPTSLCWSALEHRIRCAEPRARTRVVQGPSLLTPPVIAQHLHAGDVPPAAHEGTSCLQAAHHIATSRVPNALSVHLVTTAQGRVRSPMTRSVCGAIDRVGFARGHPLPTAPLVRVVWSRVSCVVCGVCVLRGMCHSHATVLPFSSC